MEFGVYCRQPRNLTSFQPDRRYDSVLCWLLKCTIIWAWIQTQTVFCLKDHGQISSAITWLFLFGIHLSFGSLGPAFFPQNFSTNRKLSRSDFTLIIVYYLSVPCLKKEFSLKISHFLYCLIKINVLVYLFCVLLCCHVMDDEPKKAYRPLSDLLANNLIIYDFLIGWSYLGDWQPGTYFTACSQRLWGKWRKDAFIQLHGCTIE